LLGADRAISKASAKSGVTYTRYADDLTFSGDNGAVRRIPFVEKVLGQLGYKLKERKTNVFRRGRRQMVTGLVVNVKPNLPRRLRRRLRAAVHRYSNSQEVVWQDRLMSMDQLKGRLAYLSMVQPDEAAHLKAKLMAKGKCSK
jgi:retron-type reverse transcriptase